MSRVVEGDDGRGCVCARKGGGRDGQERRKREFPCRYAPCLLGPIDAILIRENSILRQIRNPAHPVIKPFPPVILRPSAHLLSLPSCSPLHLPPSFLFICLSLHKPSAASGISRFSRLPSQIPTQQTYPHRPCLTHTRPVRSGTRRPALNVFPRVTSATQVQTLFWSTRHVHPFRDNRRSTQRTLETRQNKTLPRLCRTNLPSQPPASRPPLRPASFSAPGNAFHPRNQFSSCSVAFPLEAVITASSPVCCPRHLFPFLNSEMPACKSLALPLFSDIQNRSRLATQIDFIRTNYRKRSNDSGHPCRPTKHPENIILHDKYLLMNSPIQFASSSSPRPTTLSPSQTSRGSPSHLAHPAGCFPCIVLSNRLDRSS